MKSKERKIFLLIKELISTGVQKDEFIKKNNIKDPTFYKYIQYIKQAGFIIKNKNGFYSIFAFRKNKHMDKKDETIFANILFFAQSYLSKQKSKIILEAITDTLQNYDNNSYFNIENKFDELKSENYKNSTQRKIDEFQNYIDKKKMVEILTKNNRYLLIKPLKIILNNNKISILFYNKRTKTDEIISLNNIKKAVVKEEFEIFSDNATETIFELNDKLAKSYILKENERIIDKNPNKLIVGNLSNNKNDLFKRLLKYDIYCKVAFPKQDVEKFKEFVEQSIKNIG